MDPKSIEQLIALIRDASPMLWAAARQKVLADTISTSLFTVVTGIGVIGLALLIKSCVSKMNGDTSNDWFLGVVLSAAGEAMLLFLFMLALGGLLPLIISPDYMAIQALSKLIVP